MTLSLGLTSAFWKKLLIWLRSASVSAEYHLPANELVSTVFFCSLASNSFSTVSNWPFPVSDLSSSGFDSSDFAFGESVDFVQQTSNAQSRHRTTITPGGNFWRLHLLPFISTTPFTDLVNIFEGFYGPRIVFASDSFCKPARHGLFQQPAKKSQPCRDRPGNYLQEIASCHCHTP